MEIDDCESHDHQEQVERPRFRALRIAIALLMAVGVFYATFCWTRHIADPYFERLDYFQRVNPKNATETGRFLADCLVLIAPTAWGLATFYLFAAGVVSSTKPIRNFYCMFVDEHWIESKLNSRLSWLVYPGAAVVFFFFGVLIYFPYIPWHQSAETASVIPFCAGGIPTAFLLFLIVGKTGRFSSSAYCRIWTIAGASFAIPVIAFMLSRLVRGFDEWPR